MGLGDTVNLDRIIFVKKLGRNCPGVPSDDMVCLGQDPEV
ncbi:unnamed protein product [marine sediment metagenome]|uniref:Uncharacterized protein n=1 Tax=marine sediment metagenome TaxID=412755 RepID=X1ANP7_9ZZZZ